MLTLRYWIRLLSTFFLRFKSIILISIFLGIIGFVTVRFLLPRLIFKKTEIIGIAGRYTTQDLPEEVLDLIGQGLTQINEKGEAEPALAKRWEASDGGKIWTFFLNDGRKWQDSSSVTSASIQYSFEDVIIKRPDETTIVFELETPFAPFPNVVARPTFKKGLLGTGGWKVVNISLSREIVEELVLADSKGNQKIIKFYPTVKRTKTAFKLGEVDVVKTFMDPSPFDEWETTTLNSWVNKSQFVGIFFNNENELFKENKAARQALSYAIDKESFAGGRAMGPISSLSWAYNSQIKEYKYDKERARELLGKIDKVRLATTPALLDVVEIVSKYWADIGVTAQVQVVSQLPEDYQAYLAIYHIPDDPDQYPTWHSTQEGTNISNYKNPRIDKLLEDGRLELGQEERKKIYMDFQRFLLEDAPAIFLYHPTYYTVTRK